MEGIVVLLGFALFMAIVIAAAQESGAKAERERQIRDRVRANARREREAYANRVPSERQRLWDEAGFGMGHVHDSDCDAEYCRRFIDNP